MPCDRIRTGNRKLAQLATWPRYAFRSNLKTHSGHARAQLLRFQSHRKVDLLVLSPRDLDQVSLARRTPGRVPAARRAFKTSSLQRFAQRGPLPALTHTVPGPGRLASWLGLLLLLLCGCDVYDPAQLGVAPKPGGSQSKPVKDSGTDANPQADDAGDDGSVAEPACVTTNDPDCPVRCHEECNGADDDCDGVVDESAGESLCNLRASTSVCVAGSCLIASCNADSVDCNEQAEDGCEATLDAVEHCGLCSHRCELSHATAKCSAGTCEVASCDAGFADCDEKSENGCERALDTVNDCGGCGVTCRVPNAVTQCSSGDCEFARCEPGWGDCNEDAGRSSGGDGCETDLSSPEHCGACGQACPSNAPYCSGGKCSAISCTAGTADCDADNVDCETDLRTVDNCGSCGAACGDVENATVSCSAQGTCEPSCNVGFASCDDSLSNGCETDIRTLADCGACGVGCSFPNAASSCADGSCRLTSCNPGFGNCNGATDDGCEQRLNTLSDCADCGRACALANASVSCGSGSCQVSSCNGGYGNCDGTASNGCETNLNNSAQHCGACGRACPSGFLCQSGRCVCDSDNDCASGQRCCSGSCIDPRDDEANCGGCGIVCASGETCCSGSCKDLSNDFSNCGTCGHSCPSNTNRCSNGDCRCSNEGPCSSLLKCCSNGCHTILFCAN